MVAAGSACYSFRPRALRLATYVDDPLYVAGGGLWERVRELPVALLWVALIKYPPTWPATASGPTV
eukprot:7121897-Alexandrium_andersonii.AAC.1